MKKLGKNTPYVMLLEDNMRRELEKECKVMDLDLSQLIRIILREYLNK